MKPSLPSLIFLLARLCRCRSRCRSRSLEILLSPFLPLPCFRVLATQRPHFNPRASISTSLETVSLTSQDYSEQVLPYLSTTYCSAFLPLSNYKYNCTCTCASFIPISALQLRNTEHLVPGLAQVISSSFKKHLQSCMSLPSAVLPLTYLPFPSLSISLNSHPLAKSVNPQIATF